jgi:hypothetical protein
VSYSKIHCLELRAHWFHLINSIEKRNREQVAAPTLKALDLKKGPHAGSTAKDAPEMFHKNPAIRS